MIVCNKGEEKAKLNTFVGKAQAQALQTIALYARPLRVRLHGDLR
jgi:hypothetical protein